MLFPEVFLNVYNSGRLLRIYRPEGTNESFIKKAISMTLNIKLLYLSLENKSPQKNSCSHAFWTIYKPSPQSFDLAFELFACDVIVKMTLSLKVSSQ